MNKGTCLCGSVTWEIGDKPLGTYHCHCSMCRKAHGAAFGTYYLMHAKDFRWTSALDTVTGYASSSELERAFCSTCGSVVPNDDEDGMVYVPAGCHDQGAHADSHIFTASKARWFDITDDLPQYDAFPPEGEGYTVIADKSLGPPPQGVVRGSCLCGAVEFKVLEPFKIVHNCHCSRCRRARAAAHTTNGFTSSDAVRFIKGEEHIKTYKLPDARFFTHVFCEICGSPMPRVDPERRIALTPLGALDDDPGAKAADNIFVAYKADWYDITDALPAFDEAPP